MDKEQIDLEIEPQPEPKFKYGQHNCQCWLCRSLESPKPRQQLRDYKVSLLEWPGLEGTVSEETARKMDAEGRRKAAQSTSLPPNSHPEG